VSPFFIPLMIGNMAPGMISIMFGAKGPNLSIATACAAGTHAVGDSFKLILEGRVDAMITGGTEAVISPSCIAGFNAMKALSTRNAEPERASRPFERDRDGFVPGEGAGILILEEFEHARQRGARIYAEMVGYGLTGDGYHMTSPPPDGNGAARCMQMALDDAGIRYDQVDYINAHGTSTELNDLYETRAIKTVFKEHSHKVPISSTKSMTGTCWAPAASDRYYGAGGSRRHHATHDQLREPAEELDLTTFRTRPARPRQLRHVQLLGFGGTNAALLLKKYK
jgi:3-oxoacyl-[acyl-carrier-protein] synthase II